MKCECCGKNVDVTVGLVMDDVTGQKVPTWFGTYENQVLLAVVCGDCGRKPENKGWQEKVVVSK